MNGTGAALSARRALSLAMLFAMSSLISATAAAEYPDKPIRILATAAPGAATDTTARLVADYMSKALKQQVIVDNQAGGGGNIALGMAARAPADGYTLVITSTGFVAAPFLYSKIPYDAEKSFAPISQIVAYYNVLVTSPGFQGKTLPEYLAYAKAHPNEVTLGGGNVGGQGWIMLMKLNKMADVRVKYLAYKGSGPALVDAMGGHINSVFSDPASLSQQVAEGKLRAIGVTSPKRTKAFPNVPTIGEVVPGYAQEGWVGIFAPAGTPKEIVALLSKTVADAVKDPTVRQRFIDGDFAPIGSSPDEFAALIKSDLATYGKIITDVGIKLE
jgi:tripartite-type tricarboxylate transporter receptor subunit TctC